MLVNVRKDADEVTRKLFEEYNVLVGNGKRRWRMNNWLRVTSRPAGGKRGLHRRTQEGAGEQLKRGARKPRSQEAAEPGSRGARKPRSLSRSGASRSEQ